MLPPHLGPRSFFFCEFGGKDLGGLGFVGGSVKRLVGFDRHRVPFSLSARKRRVLCYPELSTENISQI